MSNEERAMSNERVMSGELASRIIHCDSNCVVVNKNVGEAVEGAGSGMAALPSLLADELADPGYPAAVPNNVLALPVAAHRLDVPVSGCVVFARTQAALRLLNAAFGGGEDGKTVEKRYWAVVELPQKDTPLYDTVCSENASPLHGGGELVHWIQFNPKRNRSVAFDEPGPGRKKAVLRYRLAGRGRDYLFLEIEPLTGRHHQIRAQLERAGLHVKGDLKYGARRSEKNGGIRLHARSLSFPDPSSVDGKRITVQADPPLRDNLWLAFEETAKNNEQ
jgi:23S rRNA pseudouridine1911/1915/1917 synthase